MTLRNPEGSPVFEATRAFHHGRRIGQELPQVFEEGSLVNDHTPTDLNNFIAEGAPIVFQYPNGKRSNVRFHGRDDGTSHGNLVPPGHLPPLPRNS